MPREEETAPQIRIVVRPYASALPLGCFSFAIGNTLFSAFLLHWIPPQETKLLAIMLLTFVAPLEAVACGMAFLSRDTGAATAMGIFAAAWVVQGLQLILFKFGGSSAATALLMLMLALCLAMLTFVTFRGKPLVGMLLGFATLRSAGAAWVELSTSRPVSIGTAVLGFAVSLSAFYCGFAFLLEDVKGAIQPLTARSGEAENAMAGSFQDQMKHVSNEAGIRHQL